MATSEIVEQRSLKVAGLKFAGYSQEEIAAELGVSRNTVVADLGRVSREILGVSTEAGKLQLSKSIKRAIDAVIEIASDPTHKDRLQAARTILQCTGLLSNVQVNSTTNNLVLTDSDISKRLAEVMRIRSDAQPVDAQPVTTDYTMQPDAHTTTEPTDKQSAPDPEG